MSGGVGVVVVVEVEEKKCGEVWGNGAKRGRRGTESAAALRRRQRPPSNLWPPRPNFMSAFLDFSGVPLMPLVAGAYIGPLSCTSILFFWG